MTLDALRPAITRFLDPFVRTADRLGLSPDHVSIIALICATAAAGTFYLGGVDSRWYVVGAVLVFLNGWFDLIDGALARLQSSASPGGDLLDHVLDRYADIVIIAGLAAGIERYALGFLAVTGVLMTSYLGTQAQAVGLERVYGGLVGRADRLAIIGIVAVLAAVLTEPLLGLTIIGWLLIGLAIVGHVTAIQRFVYSLKALK